MMERAHVRLVVAAVLFVGWLGWLAYIAATGTHPIILSRPQLFVADAVVVASLTGDAKPDTKVTIKKVVRGLKQQPGTEIEVRHLDECNPAEGWAGAGDYLLALSKSGTDYTITAIPESPGYDQKFDPKPMRIYPYTTETERQLKHLQPVEP